MCDIARTPDETVQCLSVPVSREGECLCYRIMEETHILCVEVFARSQRLYDAQFFRFPSSHPDSHGDLGEP